MLGLLSGIAGAIRGVSNGFLSLMATTFLWGVFSSAIIPALNMVASQNSSSQRQGLAQGLIAAGGGLGLMVGSLIRRFFTFAMAWWLEICLFSLGGIAIAISLFWQFSVKEPEHFKPAGSQGVDFAAPGICPSFTS